MGQIFRKLTAAAALVLSAACTTSQSQVPGLAGPSELALTLRVMASPDSIVQNGVSISTITISAFDAYGKPCRNLSVRMDTSVSGQTVDYGSFSVRSIVTGPDGTAQTDYTAPPPPPPALAGSTTVVTILATPSSSNCTNIANGVPQVGNAQAGTPAQTSIRLTPSTPILPPAATPTVKFTVTPTPVNLNTPTTFDASLSCPGPADSNGNCIITQIPSQIVSYEWDFGDGGTASGKVVNHTFVTAATFNVRLRVTNDRGIFADSAQQITTSPSAPPTGDWVISPTAPVVSDQVQFNATGVQPAPGHTIVQYAWDFGDPTSTSNTASGIVATHKFGAVGSYTVVLSVRDDVGQKLTTTHTVTVGSGQPKVQFTFAVTAPATHTIQVDGSGSIAAGSATIVGYAWAWGDGSSNVASAAAIASHSYGSAATYTVTLTVTDSLGRVGTFSQTVTVP